MIIYLAVGVAFLAVSLWAFLSNGKSARAIRYKYKLGGIMLTAWAMLSAASCEGNPPVVTCYEPAVTCYDVAAPVDQLYVEVKGYGGLKLKSGDVLSIRITDPQYQKYRFLITADTQTEEAPTIAVMDVEVTAESVSNSVCFEMTLPETDYKGAAAFYARGIYNTSPDSEGQFTIGSVSLEIF